MTDDEFILLADDDGNDVILLQRAFKQAGVLHRLHVIPDGQETINYLGGRGIYSNRERFPLPFLLLLDLKMPGTDGFEVLRWARNEADLKRLLIVVLTSSNLQTDVDRAYELGANSYLVKPVEFDEMVAMVQRFQSYWAEINRPPTAPRSPMPLPIETTL